MTQEQQKNNNKSNTNNMMQLEYLCNDVYDAKSILMLGYE